MNCSRFISNLLIKYEIKFPFLYIHCISNILNKGKQRIAFVAHENKKAELLEWVERNHEELLEQEN